MQQSESCVQHVGVDDDCVRGLRARDAGRQVGGPWATWAVENPTGAPGLGVVRAPEEGRAQARCDGVGPLVREMLILSGLFGYFLIRGGFSPKF